MFSELSMNMKVISWSPNKRRTSSEHVSFSKHATLVLVIGYYITFERSLYSTTSSKRVKGNEVADKVVK